MNKRIILICGGRDYGKTSTLKSLFGLKSNEKVPSLKIGNVTICISGSESGSLDSDQEHTAFCHFDSVIQKTSKRLKRCIEKYGESAIIVIPFSIIKRTREPRKGELNEDCIIKPIEWLKQQGYEIYKIYLRRIDYKYSVIAGDSGESTTEVDALMDKLGYNLKIESRDKPDEQAKEIREFISTNFQIP